MNGDLELLRSIYSKKNPQIDIGHYMSVSKFASAGVDIGNAFAFKRESERLLPIAESRRDEFRKATFVLLVGRIGPNVDSYDFKTQSFNVTFGPDVRSLSGGDLAMVAQPEGVHVVISDQKAAEYIEGSKIGHGSSNSKQQIVEVFRMKGLNEPSGSRPNLVAERVAFYKYNDAGNYILGAIWPKSNPEEKMLLDSIGYDGKLNQK
jgi:hypothetical protein